MSVPYPVINDVPPKTQVIAGLNQTIFSTNWTANTAEDVLVYSRNPDDDANDITQIVSSGDYTVQFIGDENIVQVTFLIAPDQYNIITIVRSTSSERMNLYTNTNFTSSMLNSDFGTLTLIDQELDLWRALVPHYNNSGLVNDPIDLILPDLGANQFWLKNSSNTGFVAATYQSGGGSGGVPTNASLLTYRSQSELTEAFNLGSLNSGILAQDVTGGVSTPYTLPIPLGVDKGGTGVTSITPYSLVIGGTTSTSPIVSLASLGAVGEVLTSGGPGVSPSFQTVQHTGIPIGAIIDFGGTLAPTNYLICNGDAISRTDYVQLFMIIGTTWGIGDGSTTFNIPDLRGFVTAGAGGTLPPLANSVGASGGDATHVIDLTEMPNHNHPGSTVGLSSVTNGAGSTGSPVSVAKATSSTPLSIASQGGGVAMTIVQPTAITLKCIKYA